jgi:hypothetical protein
VGASAILPTCEQVGEDEWKTVNVDERAWPLSDAMLTAVERLSAARAAGDVEGMALQSTVLAALCGELYDADEERAAAGSALAGALAPYVAVSGTAAFASYARTTELTILSGLGLAKHQIDKSVGAALKPGAFDMLALLRSRPDLNGAAAAANTVTGYGMKTLVEALARQGAIPNATASALIKDLTDAEHAADPSAAMSAFLAQASEIGGQTGVLITAAAAPLAG